MKTLLIAATGFLLGTLATGAAAFWALENGYVPGFGAPLVQPSWPDVSPEEGGKPEVPQDIKIEEPVLPVPKTTASEGFQSALQATVGSYNGLADDGALLVAKLNEMNARSSARNFDGFFDLVFEAKTLLAEQVSGTAALAAALADLERELPTVTDPSLASASARLIAKGKELTSIFGTYSASIAPVLSGKVPGQADIDTVFAAATKLQTTSKEFNEAAEATMAAVNAAYDAAPILQVDLADGAGY